MNVSENAPTKSLTIQGLNFEVPVVVTAENFDASMSDVCAPDMAAQILQQTFMENWRNNYAKKVTDAVKAAAKENGIEFSKVADLSDEDAETLSNAVDQDGLQAGLNTYIGSYVPGVRRGSGGVALSPLDRETNKLATEIVRNHLDGLGIGRTARSETYKEWDAKIQDELGMTGAEHIAEMAAALIEANPSIRETAEANIAARASLASGVELNFGG